MKKKIVGSDQGWGGGGRGGNTSVLGFMYQALLGTLTGALTQTKQIFNVCFKSAFLWRVRREEHTYTFQNITQIGCLDSKLNCNNNKTLSKQMVT